MATLISSATGNFTAAGTWKLCDATAVLDSEANNTALTTSYVASANIATGIITIDAIAVKVASRAVSPTGTMSVELYNSTLGASVAGTEVTIDVQDIANTNPSGWAVFALAAPVLLLAATNYQVRAKTSSSSQVNLYRNATAGNWSRQLRTTTNQAPAASDRLIVAGEFTGPDAANTLVVTMDSTSSATSYGQIDVCRWAAFNYGFAAATNYYLKVAGNINVYPSDAFTIGTAANPIPSGSTAKLEFACLSPVQYGLILKQGGSVTTYGNSITFSAELNANASAAATSLTTGTSTGWLNGDEIGIATTTRTASEAEKKSLTANAAGTTLTIAALTNAHLGTSPTKAKLINLTRNVQIFSTSTTNNTYITTPTTASLFCNNTEFYNMGSSTSGKRGVDIATTTGNAEFTRCSFHDFTASSAVGLNISSNCGNVEVRECVFYNINQYSLILNSTSLTTNYFDNLTAIRNTSGLPAFQFSSLKQNITNIYANGTASASSGSINLTDTTLSTFGTISGIEACGSGGIGININSVTPTALLDGKFTISNLTAWRNSSTGITFVTVNDLIATTITAFGNDSAGSNINVSGTCENLELRAMTVNAGATLTCATGITLGGTLGNVQIFDSSFGLTNTHSTGDVGGSGALGPSEACFYNCLFSSSTEFASMGGLGRASDGIGSAKHDQVVGAHKRFKRYGTISIDTTLFRTASPSVRMTPTNASFYLTSRIRRILVPNGQGGTVSIYVRKSNTSVGDSATYNGSRQPRLMLCADPAIGVANDTVLATATNAANGAWELLTGTLPTITDNSGFSVYVDCNGTAGWINIDDFTTSVSTTTSGMLYWVDAEPDFSSGAASAGGSYTFS